ncbi:MAG TPA: threonine--tRNA ligase [Caldithrix abyssi]|uniref:Threonine--tRNA ligase n=1 Tax=Caldithrix abyssi TaxID=187145 RepID=A0A7V5RNJ2_CALAY|nr:threonine--tRNA ligase [Caldithrix abyssi]
MENITVTFPDGTQKDFEAGITPLDVAATISNSLKKKAVAAKWNDRVIALNTPLEEPGTISILTFKDDEGREVFWHSSAHLMAQAIKRLYPEAELGIGPPISDGFYYDIDLDTKLTPEDLEKIEAEMAKIVDENHKITRAVLSREEALEFFEKKHEHLKLELIRELDGVITAYSQGEFTDLCRGPHVPSTGVLGKNFKLLSLAGAYWKGDEHNKMLQRIYGTNYPDPKSLKAHIRRLEEAKKRDHRKLGRELELFSINESVGSGLILWHPRGAMIRNIIENYWREQHILNGYDLVYTPHVAKHHLWETSGHSGFYSENMFKPMEVDEVSYQLKPMNCPFHMQIFNSKIRSYKDLPIRFAELGTVYRYERSGVLHGLMRVRGFTQDDAHIYCHPDELAGEISRVLDFNTRMLAKFGFTEYDIYLSTRPEKFVGSEENWDQATEALREALENNGLEYTIDPGEGVFYGPKIDIKIKDVLGRSWQCSTIQVDFNLPERFDLNFVDKDGQNYRPITIHRALLGSIERFFGILIEHYAGNFPLWLAPVQVEIITIADRHIEYAKKIAAEMTRNRFRVHADYRNEKIGYKIREAEVQKVPYMIILGDKEVEEDKISVRHKGEGDLGRMSVADLCTRLENEINSSSNN